jgi:hypothetical protein
MTSSDIILALQDQIAVHDTKILELLQLIRGLTDVVKQQAAAIDALKLHPMPTTMPFVFPSYPAYPGNITTNATAVA